MVTLVETISESKVNGSRLGRGFGCWSAASRDSCCSLLPSGDCSPAGAQRMVQNLYQGVLQGPVAGFYYIRARCYVPYLGRWIHRDPIGYQGGVNLYEYVGGNPVGKLDSLGEAGKCTPDCGSAPSLPANSPVCDKYGTETYPGTGVSLFCSCKCAGNSPWSQEVRGCLACEYAKGTDITEAHLHCYRVASWHHVMPHDTLINCFKGCGGEIPPIVVM